MLTNIQESLQSGNCVGQNVAFEVLKKARDVVVEQFRLGDDENELLGKTLQDVCEKAAQVKDCVLPEDVNAAVQSLLDGQSIVLECGQGSQVLNGAMDLLPTAGGCVTHLIKINCNRLKSCRRIVPDGILKAF